MQGHIRHLFIIGLYCTILFGIIYGANAVSAVKYLYDLYKIYPLNLSDKLMWSVSLIFFWAICVVLGQWLIRKAKEGNYRNFKMLGYHSYLLSIVLISSFFALNIIGVSHLLLLAKILLIVVDLSYFFLIPVWFFRPESIPGNPERISRKYTWFDIGMIAVIATNCIANGFRLLNRTNTTAAIFSGHSTLWIVIIGAIIGMRGGQFTYNRFIANRKEQPVKKISLSFNWNYLIIIPSIFFNLQILYGAWGSNIYSIIIASILVMLASVISFATFANSFEKTFISEGNNVVAAPEKAHDEKEHFIAPYMMVAVDIIASFLACFMGYSITYSSYQFLAAHDWIGISFAHFLPILLPLAFCCYIAIMPLMQDLLKKFPQNMQISLDLINEGMQGVEAKPASSLTTKETIHSDACQTEEVNGDNPLMTLQSGVSK